MPVGDEPRCAWVERDDIEIAKLVRLATSLIDELYRRTTLARTGSDAAAAPAAGREAFRALALSD